MSQDPGLRYEVSNGIATIILDRPERKNAFTFPMIDAWVARLREAGDDDAVRVIVVTGAGDSFCSGIDLDSLADFDASPLGRKKMLTTRIHHVALAIDELDKPVIGALRGVAVGAGMDMALLCDMRIASHTARLSEGYIKAGLVPGDGGAWLLPRLVGTAKAMELLMTGEFIDATTALTLGIVNRVVDDADLLPAVYEFASRIAAGPPVQISMIRRMVRQAERVDFRTHLDLVSSHMGIVGSLADLRETVSARREGRTPTYQGR
jgi:enoyl-CoA hydratase/carnithine racemase